MYNRPPVLGAFSLAVNMSFHIQLDTQNQDAYAIEFVS